MNKITLRNDGLITQNDKVVEGDPLMLLSCGVELEAGCTLRSFFRLFEHYAVLTKLNPFLPDCLGQFRACPPSRCTCDAIDHLAFCKTIEMIGFPGEPRLEIYSSLYGVRGNATCEIKSYPFENLLDMPVKLGKLKHVIFGDKVDIFEFDTVFSLFEFIDGIVWELSFHGTSKECALRR
ncbi:MAG: hypothetical protein JSW39_12455 [Desulfobacterales bacterium]|nr:MAG: hypothetical protein JSW39_12455 [Desulfobacterales bacterium]